MLVLVQRRGSFRLGAWFGGGLVVLAASCAPDATECAADRDCDEGRHCAEGACVEASGLSVRVLSLTASPSTVGPGDDVTLRWATRNASACELSPGAGVVPRVGTFTIAIAETTTFTLACEGPGGPATSTTAVTVIGSGADAGALDGGGRDGGEGEPDDDAGEPEAGPSGGEDGGTLDGGPPPVDAGTDAGGDAGPASNDAGPEAYATSCSDLRVRGGVTSDGVYTLDPDGPGGAAPFEAWCDMTTEGGGWTLVLKVDGTKSTFRYQAELWTSTTLLNSTAVTPTETEAKLHGYLALPFDRVRVAFESGGNGGARGISLALSAPSLRALMASGTTATDEGPEAWGALDDGDVLPAKCLREGVNVDVGGVLFPGSSVRLGVFADNTEGCLSPDDYVGVGFSFSLTCPSLPTAGSTSTCAGTNLGDAAFATVWVRDEDFTDLSPKASCAAHLASGRTVSGLYTLSLGGSPVEAYCDMTTDGGGWTLAGASVEGGSAAAFGWRSTTGSVRDDEEPYSLGALSLGLSFDEALLGRRGTGKALRSNAYRVALPDAFFGDGGRTQAYPTEPVPVLGDCLPVSYSMLRTWGHTELTTHFHIRDNAPATDLGLRPSGSSLWYEDCAQGALLEGTQGLLFVR